MLGLIYFLWHWSTLSNSTLRATLRHFWHLGCCVAPIQFHVCKGKWKTHIAGGGGGGVKETIVPLCRLWLECGLEGKHPHWKDQKNQVWVPGSSPYHPQVLWIQNIYSPVGRPLASFPFQAHLFCQWANMVLIRTLIQAINVCTHSTLLLDPNTPPHKVLNNTLIHRFDVGCKHCHMRNIPL